MVKRIGLSLLLAVGLAASMFAASRAERLLNAQTIINTAVAVTGQPDPRDCRESVVYIVWSAGTSAGAVQVETANDATYTGTWAPLGDPVAWTAVSRQDVVQITGVNVALRTRISTAIVGGTVTTWFACN